MRSPTGDPDRPARRQPCHTDATAVAPIRLKAPTVGRVKGLHTAYRVTDLAASADLYSALGYQEVGRISVGDGATLTVLKFPGEEVVTLELVHRPADGPVQVGTGFSHLVVQVDELAGTIAALSQCGLQPEPEQHPAGPDGPLTSWLTDPDGYRIELVQWPAGHPAAKRSRARRPVRPDRRASRCRPSARELRDRSRSEAIAGDLRGFRAWQGRPGANWMLGRRGKQRPTLACENGQAESRRGWRFRCIASVSPRGGRAVPRRADRGELLSFARV